MSLRVAFGDVFGDSSLEHFFEHSFWGCLPLCCLGNVLKLWGCVGALARMSLEMLCS